MYGNDTVNIIIIIKIIEMMIVVEIMQLMLIILIQTIVIIRTINSAPSTAHPKQLSNYHITSYHVIS